MAYNPNDCVEHFTMSDKVIHIYDWRRPRKPGTLVFEIAMAMAMCRAHESGPWASQQSNLSRYRAWSRTWLAYSTHVYVYMNFLAESAGEKNE